MTAAVMPSPATPNSERAWLAWTRAFKGSESEPELRTCRVSRDSSDGRHAGRGGRRSDRGHAIRSDSPDGRQTLDLAALQLVGERPPSLARAGLTGRGPAAT